MQEKFQTESKQGEEGVVEGGSVVRIKDESPLIEGGEVKGVEETKDFHERKHRAYTASKLGITLVWMLGLSFLVNFAGKMYLEMHDKHEAAQALSDEFKTWLPVIASLSAAAVAYYFSKEQEK
ncbi:MAG TPA: hypothetical protein VF556_03225 [Pyrinomonadaceae bacterium]|jgi:hypothetical protein